MAKQVINIGAAANDGSGDPIRNAFNKSNSNFNELYFALGGDSPVTLFDGDKNFRVLTRANKISFFYNTEASIFDLSENTHRGCIAQAQDTGYLYYSDGSEWVKLAKYDELGTGGGGAAVNTFGTIAVAGQPSVVADSLEDTFSFVAGSNITITTDAGEKEITISSSGGSASALNDLSDTTISNPTNGQVLKYNGTTWVNAAESAGGNGSSTFAGLTDTPVNLGTAGQVVQVNAGGDALEFATLSTYTDSDVDTHLNVGSAATGQVLSWSGSDYTWTTPSSGGGSSTFADLTEINTAGLEVHDIARQAATTLVLTANGASSYRFDQYGTTDNPTIYAKAGTTIAFDLTAISGHPFQIQTTGSSAYNTGLIHVATNGTVSTGASAQGKTSGTLYWKVPASISGTYEYICQFHGAMNGNIEIEAAAGAGGGASLSRVTEAKTTASIADGASDNLSFTTLGLSYSLYSVQTDKAAWIRIYSDTASRTADAGRTQGSDPAEGAGIVAEFIATGPTTFKITPAIFGYIDDGETEIPVSVQNNSGSTGTVELSITALKLEA